jgi:uroporphyrinogen-III decarboxylase
MGCKVQAHNCGRADHLLGFWKDQVRVDRYIGFSYLTDKKALRDTMGGTVFLMGGVDTVKLHDGTPEDVREDCRLNLAVFKDTPGYVMMDGHNVAPGTPLANINAMAAAAEQYGRL